MILQILLLIVGTYLSISFTLFFVYLKIVNKTEVDKLKLDMKKRDAKLDEILYLLK